VNPKRRALALTGLVSLLLLLPLPSGLSELARGELLRLGKDKIVHAILFAALGWAWAATFAPPRLQAALAVFGLLVVWGGVLELAQDATGWRSAEASDLVADALGIAVGIALSRRRRGGPDSWTAARGL
jgi:VanZ family protein